MEFLTDPWSWWVEPFTGNAFMLRALTAGLLTVVATSVVGTWLVLRGMTYLGDALAHGVLPGIAMAYVFGGSTTLGALLAALVMVGGIHVVRQHSPLPDDVSIGLLFVAMLIVGASLGGGGAWIISRRLKPVKVVEVEVATAPPPPIPVESAEDEEVTATNEPEPDAQPEAIELPPPVLVKPVIEIGLGAVEDGPQNVIGLSKPVKISITLTTFLRKLPTTFSFITVPLITLL